MTRIIALAFCVFLLGGCSFMFSRPPHRSLITNEAPACTPHYVTSVIDAWNAVGGLVLTAAVANEGSDHASEQDTMGLIAGILLVETGVYTASAIYGMSHARACKRMQLEPAPVWAAPAPSSEWPPEVEQTVDADENQIDIHTTIRRMPQPQ